MSNFEIWIILGGQTWPLFFIFKTMEKKEKQLFKIWDRTKKRYITGDKSKTSWRSMKWILSKIDDLCKESSYCYSGGNNRKPEEFEIRIFELQLVDQIDARTLYLKDKERKRNLENSNILIRKLEKEIESLLPDLKLSSIKKMYDDKVLSEELMDLLKPKFDNLTKEKILLNNLSKPIK
jgi:hypothetical protein